MLNSEFGFTEVHYRLRQYFKTLKLPTWNTSELQKEMRLLGKALCAELTTINRIERCLREYIVSCLRKHLEDVDSYVRAAKTRHNIADRRAQMVYFDELQNFREGDYGYDYEGAIYPTLPSRVPFNEEEVRQARKAELAMLDLDNPAVILANVPVQTHLLGDMLYEHFITCNFMEKLIANIDFTGLEKPFMIYFLRNLDVSFPDLNILNQGFLLNVLKDSIHQAFSAARHQDKIDNYIDSFFQAMEKKSACKQLLKDYNAAAKHNDNLELQRLWFYLAPLCNLVVTWSKTPSPSLQRLVTAVDKEHSKLCRAQGNTLRTLIKVFPSDDVDHLVYPGIAPKTDNYYPYYDTKLPLKPCFHTLELMARQTHQTLVNVAGKKSGANKTNVVSAMLCFVVSVEPETAYSLSLKKHPAKTCFINIPINFDYGCSLVSVDEAFSSKDDLERSIGDDLELGTRVAGRSTLLPKEKSTTAKNLMKRLLETLKLTPSEKARISSTIEAAPVAKPVTLLYLTDNDVAKSTEHRHSERVLNRALKKPKNIKKIIASLRQKLSQQVNKKGTYTIHSAALLVYSYPNSICDSCSISFLALQNSYKTGFLAKFIATMNAADPTQAIQLRTRGYNTSRQQQDPNEFGITVIAGSSKAFAKDAYAKLVANRPHTKLTCRGEQSIFATPGINLMSSTQRKNRFFEFTAGSTIHKTENTTVNYRGILFMSGSKKSKVTSKAGQKKLETQVKDVISKNQVSHRTAL